MAVKDQQFAEAVLAWFAAHGRHDLPWQQDKSAYRVWLSEIMLQQTQVATVIPYYRRFLHRFPSIVTLANANIDDVLQLWQGLGYYARARNLHRAAVMIRDSYDGRFPTELETVLTLPGIGRSTAGAILSFAYEQSWPILDGNVKRVLSRCFQVPGWYGQSATMKRLWSLSERLTPRQNTADFNQAMMDLGATRCLKSKPDCEACPLNNCCQSFAQNTQQLFPHKKPRKIKPQKQTLMLVNRFEDRVLLYRRPPSGIWGGLWSLPEVTGEAEMNNWQDQVLRRRLQAESINENQLKHQFTHFSLDISVAIFRLTALPDQINDDEHLVFAPLNRLQEYGLPTPVRRILKSIHSHS